MTTSSAGRGLSCYLCGDEHTDERHAALHREHAERQVEAALSGRGLSSEHVCTPHCDERGHYPAPGRGPSECATHNNDCPTDCPVIWEDAPVAGRTPSRADMEAAVGDCPRHPGTPLRLDGNEQGEFFVCDRCKAGRVPS